MGPITLTDDTVLATYIIIAVLLLVLFLTFKKSQHTDVFPIPVTNELKGLGILTIVFAHIAYMKVTNADFLFPLSIIAGVGVDLFLFMSGFGLSVGMLKRPMKTWEFYKKRVIKIFIPFWVALIIIFAADAIFLKEIYLATSLTTTGEGGSAILYFIRSMFGFFPTALGYGDVNSPFWYITWMILFYLLYPILFFKDKPWLTALILAIIATLIGTFNPGNLGDNWLHRLHSLAFPLGIVAAWLLQVKEGKENKLINFIKNLRDNNVVLRCAIVVIMIIIAFYFSLNTTSASWPTLTKIFVKGFYVDQLMSLIITFAFIVAFTLKRFDNRFFAIFGTFSYEVYLVHWPLIGRYDIFFTYLPSWLAVIVWMVVLILVSMLLSKIVKPISAFVDKIAK